MALLVFNKTTSALLLAAGNPRRTVPASSAPGVRGPAMNVTSELRGLTGGNYTSLQAQVGAGSCEYEWTSDAEYATGTLVVGGPAPGGHKATHATGGGDALATASVTPTNNAGNAVPVVTDGGHAHASSAVTDGGHTHASSAVTDGGHTHASSAVTDGGHTHASSAVTDGGHTHSVSVNAQRIAGHVHYAAPLAADAGGAVATYKAAALPANGAAVIAAQPDVPRKVQVEQLTAGCTTGDITIDGVDPSGNVISEAFPLTAVALLLSVKAYARITAITIANVTGAAGTVGVGPSSDLGLPISNTPAGSGVAVFKECLDGVDEAVGAVDAAAGTVAPSHAPDGVHDFDFWFTFSMTPTAPASGSATTGVTVGATASGTTGVTVGATASGTTGVTVGATASGTTGVTVGATASGTTGVTVADSGHNHTQNAHSHNVTT